MGIVVTLIIGATIITAISPMLGFIVGLALFLIPGFALIRPIEKIGLGHRGFSFSVASLVGFPIFVIAVGLLGNQEQSRLAELKISDPDTYLTEMKEKGSEEWMTALAELDPEQHAEELQRQAEREAAEAARRQEEAEANRLAQEAEAQRIAEETEARRVAERERQQAALKEKVQSHLDQLDREIASIPGIRAHKYTDSVAEINVALLLIGAWTMLYEEGDTLPLDDAGQAKRQMFRDMVVRKQVEMFPVLRDAYGPAMRRELWEADASARTIGSGFRTVEFVAAPFVRNANIKQIHSEIHENLKMLRFNRAQYKWIRDASEFSYYTLDVPSDRDLVTWLPGARYRVVE